MDLKTEQKTMRDRQQRKMAQQVPSLLRRRTIPKAATSKHARERTPLLQEDGPIEHGLALTRHQLDAALERANQSAWELGIESSERK